MAILTACAVGLAARRTIEDLQDLATRSPLPEVSLAEDGPEMGPGAYRKDYSFTSDWFTKDIPVWKKAMAPLGGRPGVRYLEVGVYEGRSALWMLENVLTDPSSRVVVVDPFTTEGTEARWRANLAKSGESARVETIKGLSGDVLPGLAPSSFDVIYIDGSHATADVMEDAVFAWRLLKPRGLLIFDDYHYAMPATAEDGGHFPKRAVDAFADAYGSRLDVVHVGSQVLLRKKGR